MKIKQIVLIFIILISFAIIKSFAQVSFSDITALSIRGKISTGSRYIVGYDIKDLESFLDTITVFPYMETNVILDYSGDNVEGVIDLRNDITDANELTVKINEAYIHFFLSPLDLMAGYAKVVWGKGDGIHVIDNLNANDYRDFINRDYLDRRVAEYLMKLGLTVGETGYFEFVYEPVFTPDIYPETGIWFPAKASELNSIVTSVGGNYILPDTNTSGYGQYAARYTFSMAGVDIGLSDYFGFLREPVIDISRLTTEGTVSLSYDRVNVFGFESSAIIFGFNTWTEIAYNFTYDYKGNDPMVHNNSVQYLIGFDRDIPIDNLYINVQLIGSYILNNNKIKTGDIEYEIDGCYTNNIIAWSLWDTFLNDTLKLELDGAYSFEHKDLMLKPKASLSLTDDLNLIVFYTYFGGEADTNFGQYKDNSFIELRLTYEF